MNLKKSFVITNQKLESWTLMIRQKKKNELDPSFSVILEDLKEQAKFLENKKLLQKEQLINFKNHKIHLFKKGQYSNSTRAAYQDLISFAGVSANKVEKVVDIVLTQIAGLK